MTGFSIFALFGVVSYFVLVEKLSYLKVAAALLLLATSVAIDLPDWPEYQCHLTFQSPLPPAAYEPEVLPYKTNPNGTTGEMMRLAQARHCVKRYSYLQQDE